MSVEALSYYFIKGVSPVQKSQIQHPPPPATHNSAKKNMIVVIKKNDLIIFSNVGSVKAKMTQE